MLKGTARLLKNTLLQPATLAQQIENVIFFNPPWLDFYRFEYLLVLLQEAIINKILVVAIQIFVDSDSSKYWKQTVKIQVQPSDNRQVSLGCICLI